MTTREDIKRWLQFAPKHATHMIVVCDGFDYEDYPVFVKPDEDFRKLVAERYSGRNMQRMMEVYDLSKPLDPQIAKDLTCNF